MAVNYAEKYSTQIDERFAIESKTEALVNRNYDWDGVSTIHVYGVDTPELNNYKMTGDNRFGVPEELSNTKTKYVLNEDKAFTGTIDRRNNLDTNGVMEAGNALARTLREKVVPYVDKYRLAKIVAGAGTVETLALTKNNIYEQILKAQETLSENLVPTAGRVLVMAYPYYNLLKLDPAFIKVGDLSQNMLIKGSVGMVDGVNVILVPSAWLPSNAAFVLLHNIAVIGAEKLVEFRVLDNQRGISGWVMEGRIYFDCFILENKKKAIYAHKVA